MKFMNVIKNFKSRQDYVDYRNQMLDEATQLLDDGKMDEYKAKLEDVETLDDEYTQYTEAKANVESMKGAVKVPNVLSNASHAGAKDGIVASVGDIVKEDPTNSIEYRSAFMNYVLHGEKMAANFTNSDEVTTTSDTGAVIPNTILNKIVEKMEKTGDILNKVTRTFYKGGATVPTSAAKPVATWTTERGKTDKQKKTLGSITFSYFKLKCVVAVSIAVDTVTLDVFERTLTSNIAEAMVKALEKAIIAGEGASANQPEGILSDAVEVVEGQKVEIAKGKDITFKNLCDAEGKLPAAYESAEWYMTKSTYFNQIAAMTDTSGQPIARVNAGVSGKPEYRILGRPVNFVSSESMSDFSSTVSADTVVAFMFRMEDYILNTNLNVTVKRYEDHETDDQVTKAIMMADGKVVDNNSLVEVIQKNL